MGKAGFWKRLLCTVRSSELVYDDERILGGLDWNVAGRYHDALKLGYANKNNEIHAILAFNQNDEKRQVVLITILLLVSLTRICRLCGITIKQIRFRSGLLYCL